jgi:hypothetical protein
MFIELRKLGGFDDDVYGVLWIWWWFSAGEMLGIYGTSESPDFIQFQRISKSFDHFITCHLLYKSCFIKDRSKDFRGNQKPWHLTAICGFPLKPFCYPKKIDLKPGTKCEQMGKRCHVLIMAWFIWIRGQPGRGKFADDGSVLTFVSVMICSKWFLASGVQKSA